MSFADDRHSAARKKMRARIASLNGKINRLGLQHDEEEFIAKNQGRCLCCGHLEALHLTDPDACQIPGCDCINGEMRPRLPYTPEQIDELERLFSEFTLHQTDFGTVTMHPHPLFDKQPKNQQTDFQ